MKDGSFCLVPKDRILTACKNYREVDQLMDQVSDVLRELVMSAYSKKKVFDVFNKTYRFFSGHTNASKYLPEEYYGQHWECVSGYCVYPKVIEKLEAMCELSDEIYLDKIDSVVVDAYENYTTTEVKGRVVNKLRKSYESLVESGEDSVAIQVLKACNKVSKIGEVV